MKKKLIVDYAETSLYRKAQMEQECEFVDTASGAKKQEPETEQ